MTILKPAGAKAQHTRRKIIEAAIRIIASQGIEKATTREISSEAEVANGLVTHYLKSQDELFTNVIQFIATAAYNEIETAPDDMAPREKILWMCEKNLDFFLKYADYAKCFLLFYYYASIDPALRALNDILDKRAISRLETYLRQAQSSNTEEVSAETLWHAAASLHAQIVSSVIRYYAVPQTIDKEAYRDDFLKRCQWLIGKIC